MSEQRGGDSDGIAGHTLVSDAIQRPPLPGVVNADL